MLKKGLTLQIRMLIDREKVGLNHFNDPKAFMEYSK